MTQQRSGVAGKTRRQSLRSRIALVAFALLGAAAFAVPAVHPTWAQAAKRDDKDKPARPSVTFTGFHQFADGSSRIWVRLTKAVSVEERPGKEKVVFVLKGAKVPGRNNKNALITSYFTSSVMSARLVPSKHDAELVVTLKQPVNPKHRVVMRPDGTTSVQIDFPAPSAPSK